MSAELSAPIESVTEGRALDDIERERPPRAVHVVLIGVVLLMALLLAIGVWGRLDVVATAEGRLVPQSFMKIVQPSEGGRVQDILVKVGDRVQEGQLLVRMDAVVADADQASASADLTAKSLQLRRVEAELNGRPLVQQSGDSAVGLAQALAQFQARRQGYLDALDQEARAHARALHDVDAAREALRKLQASVPMLERQARAWSAMSDEGYAARLQAEDKVREYREREQDLRAQQATVQALEAAAQQAKRRMDQVSSNYRAALYNERMDLQAQIARLQQDLTKQRHRAGLTELRAPQAGLIKDVNTYTPGTVVQPGAVLLTLVPDNEPLRAEVRVHNDDVGFVREGDRVRLKVQAYPFQKYGMVEGEIEHLSPDSRADAAPGGEAGAAASGGQAPHPPDAAYVALVRLKSQTLQARGEPLRLVPGMQVVAEIHQGHRTPLEYLLSPVRKVLHEGGRER